MRHYAGLVRPHNPGNSVARERLLNSLPLRRQAVWAVLDYMGAATDEQLVTQYVTLRLTLDEWAWLPRQSASGIRTRRHELVVIKLVVDTGKLGTLLSGRQGIIWEARP